ncbi:hypothetical protein J4E91_006380 [Alternaria rosae]|nr:hypothetical protein J4E91_006380 [Alternaria rosae]
MDHDESNRERMPEDYDDYDKYEANNLAWSTMMPDDYNDEAIRLAWTMKESVVDVRPTLGGFEINEEAGRPHPITGMSPSCSVARSISILEMMETFKERSKQAGLVLAGRRLVTQGSRVVRKRVLTRGTRVSTALTRRRLRAPRSEADIRALRDEDDKNLTADLSVPSFNPILPPAQPANYPTPRNSKPKIRRAMKPPTITSNVPVRPHLPRFYTPPTHCLTCMAEKGIRNMSCTLCHQCHSNGHTTSKCKMLRPKFHKFMDLSVELRQRIYAIALDIDRPIRPHLCDYTNDQVIQFHDDNAEHHFAISDLLGITRVSKQVREESIPMLYSTNTFSIGYDTSTYFDCLAYLGRFHMVRHVRFQIDNRKECMSPSILRRMNQYIKEVDVYEQQLTRPIGQHLSSLKKHPQYLYGGCPELNTLITLMKLTSRLDNVTNNQYGGKGKGKTRADTNPTFHSKLVVPVSSVANFVTYDGYKWFPTVMYGLGIQLHYVDNVDFAFVSGGTVSITWKQRLQKKDFGDIPDYVDPVDSSGQTAAYKMALMLDPGLEQRQRPKAWAYLRETCTGGIRSGLICRLRGVGLGIRWWMG